MTGAGLDILLRPERVAIVGLSTDPAKHGRRVLRNLRRLGYTGTIWGVHPRAGQVDGVAVYPSVLDLPQAPDAVVCAVPAHHIPPVVRDAGEVGAAAAVIFSGGFAEQGEAGRRAQEDLLRTARASGVRLLGPNSGGVIHPGARLALSFLTCLDRPAEQVRSGAVGLVTQSGGTGSYLHTLAADSGGGLAVSVSTGNEADLGLADAIHSLVRHDEVRSIALVLETVRNGPGFRDAVARATRAGKPVVACRLGTTERGRVLMRSHTGALAAPDEVLHGICDALGITLTETPAELLEVAELLARCRPPAGRSVGIVTHSGGTAILLGDLATRAELALPQPGPRLARALDDLVDHGASGNPLDMGAVIGGPHRFAETVRRFAGSGDFDLVLAVTTPHPPPDSRSRAEALVQVGHGPVPVLHLWMAGGPGRDGLEVLREHDVPVTEEPRAAVRALAGLVRRYELANEPPLSHVVGPGLPDTSPAGPAMTEHEAKRVLSSWGVPVVAGGLAATPDEAAALATRIGFPVVVKISSPDLPHKTDVGGVRLDLADAEAVRQAATQVLQAARTRAPRARLDGVRVEAQRGGRELIVGLTRDPTFGPVVLVGAGGVLAEVVPDMAVAPAPVSPTAAGRLVDRLRCRAALGAVRGEPATDAPALARLVSDLSHTFVARPDLAEVEINPLAWTADGWVALDALVRTYRGAGCQTGTGAADDTADRAETFRQGGDVPPRQERSPLMSEPSVPAGNTLSLSQAQAVVAATLAHGESIGTAPLTVAALDSGGHLVALARQDGAGIARPQIAIGKAWIALGMGFGTRELARRAELQPHFVDALPAVAGAVPAAGGVLVRGPQGTLLGAVGVSGDTSDRDEQCAVAGIGSVGLTAVPGVGD